MNIATHHRIDRRLCGNPVELSEGRAVVEFDAVEDMAADGKGLVHGGFIFGLADYAAMLSVNHPYVVLGGAEVRFSRPVKVGDRVMAEAVISSDTGRKKVVDVSVARGDEVVFSGVFTCFILDEHVLDAG